VAIAADHGLSRGIADTTPDNIARNGPSSGPDSDYVHRTLSSTTRGALEGHTAT